MNLSLTSTRFFKNKLAICEKDNLEFLITLGTLDYLFFDILQRCINDNDIRYEINSSYCVFFGLEYENNALPVLLDPTWQLAGKYADEFSSFLKAMIVDYNNIQVEWDEEDVLPTKLDLNQSNDRYRRNQEKLYQSYKIFLEKVLANK